jgi:UrcA family protein
MMRSLMIAAAAAGLLIEAPATATPPNPDAAPTAAVSFGDLDLSSSAGQRQLRRRLDWALEAVCGSYANAVEFVDEERVTNCRQTALAEAHRQLASFRQ